MDEPNGGKARGSNGAPAPPRASDEALSAADQSIADSEQTLSDADQTLSDSDQTGAEDDQRDADADQAASDRDQIAADRESAQGLDEEGTRAFAASRADREQSAAQRTETSDLRSLTMIERAGHGARRDEQAALRDARADARDQAARMRDEASEAQGDLGSEAAEAVGTVREQAAADRARAAEDRKRAAEDRKQAAQDRIRAMAELERAHLDELTGFYLRRLGMAVLQGEINRSNRAGTPLALVYCDVDGLKRVNDEAGHAAGDGVLRAVAEALRSRLRSYDSVVRVGGDEFVCALPGAALSEAREVMQQVQEALAVADCPVSVSFGLAGVEPGDTLAALMARSDQNLAEARADARD